MMFSRSLLLLTSVVGLASSQTAVTLDPNSVDKGTRDQWCLSQTASCPLICLQIPGASDTPKSNTCNSKSLAYSCVCSNGIQPNASEYSQTIPYFICTEQNNQCVNGCGGISTCQSACRDNNPCGAQNPKRVNVTTTSTTATAATGTGARTDVVYNGFGSDATGTSSAQEGLAPKAFAINLGQVYGLSAVVGGFLAGFAFLL